jgi:hypothetical protein
MFDEEFTVMNLLNFHDQILFTGPENQLETFAWLESWLKELNGDYILQFSTEKYVERAITNFVHQIRNTVFMGSQKHWT